MLNATRNMVRNCGSKIATVGTGAMILAGQAHAALPPEVATSLSDAKADGVTVAVGIFLVVLGIAVWKHLRGAK